MDKSAIRVKQAQNAELGTLNWRREVQRSHSGRNLDRYQAAVRYNRQGFPEKTGANSLNITIVRLAGSETMKQTRVILSVRIHVTIVHILVLSGLDLLSSNAGD